MLETQRGIHSSVWDAPKNGKTSQASAFQPNLEGVKHFQMAAENYCRVCRLLFLKRPPSPPWPSNTPPALAREADDLQWKNFIYSIYLFISFCLSPEVRSLEKYFRRGRSRNRPLTTCHHFQDSVEPPVPFVVPPNPHPQPPFCHWGIFLFKESTCLETFNQPQWPNLLSSTLGLLFYKCHMWIPLLDRAAIKITELTPSVSLRSWSTEHLLLRREFWSAGPSFLLYIYLALPWEDNGRKQLITSFHWVFFFFLYVPTQPTESTYYLKQKPSRPCSFIHRLWLY